MQMAGLYSATKRADRDRGKTIACGERYTGPDLVWSRITFWYILSILKYRDRKSTKLHHQIDIKIRDYIVVDKQKLKWNEMK